jgi:alpha-ketoglutarate-dependent taurine dioxygenase
MNGATTKVMYTDRRSPLVVEPTSPTRDIADLVAENIGSISTELLEHGAVLFRGFPVREVSDFDRFIGAISQQRIDYVYRSTPRTSLGNRIFTATEYPPPLEIPLHNENAYQTDWPLKLALCCLKPSESGGETPISDMRRVNSEIGADLLDKFEQRRVKYVRHYRPYVDISWQDVFRTEDRGVVADFCKSHDIAHEWLDATTLRTSQICQGTALHPVTKERVFFNQAHLFHLSSLSDAAAKSMLQVFGPDKLPRQTFFGDGTDIPDEDLNKVRAAFAKSSITFPWKAGDILLLDNMQFAHGRRPFKGTRRVVAALLEPNH